MSSIMKTFRMGGVLITTPRRFAEHFSPGDFLRNREMAAGFARLQLEGLTPWHNYHGEILYEAVFRWDPDPNEPRKTAMLDGDTQDLLFMSAFREQVVRKKISTGKVALLSEKHWITGPGSYVQLDPILRNVEKGGENYKIYGGRIWRGSEVDNLKACMAGKCPDTLADVWDIAQKTQLPEEDRKKLFVILSAGYFLADKTVKACPITPEDAQAAYLRKPLQQVNAPVKTADGFVFPARDEPYMLLGDPPLSTSGILTITLRKLTAAPSAQGSRQKPALLLFGGQRVEILPGDYRYASFVDGQMVRIFDTVKENGPVRMERKGNVITLTENGILLKTVDCSDRSIVDFASDTDGNYMLLEPDRLDLSQYSTANLPTQRIVEIRIEGNKVMQLTNTGRILCNGYLQKGKYPTTLY